MMKSRLFSYLSVCSLVILAGCSDSADSTGSSTISSTSKNVWYAAGNQSIQAKVAEFKAIQNSKGGAKNVIIFVGDGMGMTTVTAARILEGQLKGQSGEENTLSFENFPFSGLSKTYNVNAQTPDSAGTMSAIITGVKTDSGVISIDENVELGDCASGKGNELTSAFDLAEIAGLSTGIVTTTRITHATPAATYAKSASRDWEGISKMPGTQVIAGCEDIALQLVNFERNLEARYDGLDVDGLDVVMGGGSRHFSSFESGGARTDNRNLIDEWTAQYKSGQYIENKTQLQALQTESTSKLFALFSSSHMEFAAAREEYAPEQPSLTQMTEAAINILDNNENGFLLMVEAGRIDHSHHNGNAYNALHDTVELSNAVKKAAELTSRKDTLIIVTADHSHGFTVTGYNKRGNDILGKVIEVGASKPSLAADGLPYTTLGYANGPGASDEEGTIEADTKPGHRPDLTKINTAHEYYYQESAVPLGMETHGAEDVAIYAQGPGAHLVTGTNEQNVIFHIMDYGQDLQGKANKVLASKK
jgi:alkaline phosphatase